jgi:hypothetical protein
MLLDGTVTTAQQEHLAEQVVQLVKAAAGVPALVGLDPRQAAVANEVGGDLKSLQEAISSFVSELGLHLGAVSESGARQQLLEVLACKLALVLLQWPLSPSAVQWLCQLF